MLYLSDFHFTEKSRAAALRISEVVRTEHPNMLLLGGDYADSKRGLRHFEEMLEALPLNIPKCAIAGNHDFWLGIGAVKNVLLRQGVEWLEGGSTKWRVGQQQVELAGNNPAAISQSDGFLNILCLHKPLDIQVFAPRFHLAFAGHLHGSQVVLWEKNDALFPGRWAYRWNRLRGSLGHCAYFISRGLGDTLPIRYNCPKEVLAIRCCPDQ